MNVLIFGATSAIAEATARCFATQSARFFLVARNSERLDAIAKDLVIRGAQAAEYEALDLAKFEQHEACVRKAREFLGKIDVVLIAHGTLSDQSKCEHDAVEALREMELNFLSPVSLLTHLFDGLMQQRSGVVAVITSVAGDRGRASNYVYGSAKGGLSRFLEGYRNRLYSSGVSVLDIRPGFVDTPMTHAFKKGALWAKPISIGRGIYKACLQRRNGVIYLPWFWKEIMCIIRSIPAFIFNRMKL